MWEKVWRWADVKMSRCERRCGHEQMWRWADVREDVDMSRCEDEQMWEKMWRWADVKMSRCERRCEDEQMWRWADVREDVKMSRCEDEQMWRWADVREDVWKWADVKMSRCERRCEDEQIWRWADVKMRRCEDEKVRRWEGEIQTPTIGRTLRSDALGKNVGRRGTFEEDLQRCMSRGRRSTRDIFIRALGGQGVDFRWFPDKGCSSEHQTCRFANVILRDRCSTSYDLAFISWQAQYFRQMECKNRKTHWYDSTFHFWRTTRRIASFWCCQLPNFRTPRKIALFLTLSS